MLRSEHQFSRDFVVCISTSDKLTETPSLIDDCVVPFDTSALFAHPTRSGACAHKKSSARRRLPAPAPRPHRVPRHAPVATADLSADAAPPSSLIRARPIQRHTHTHHVANTARQHDHPSSRTQSSPRADACISSRGPTAPPVLTHRPGGAPVRGATPRGACTAHNIGAGAVVAGLAVFMMVTAPMSAMAIRHEHAANVKADESDATLITTTMRLSGTRKRL